MSYNSTTRIFICFLVLFGNLGSWIYAQNSAEALYKKGLNPSYSPQEKIDFFQQSSQIFQQDQDWVSFLDCGAAIAKIYFAQRDTGMTFSTLDKFEKTYWENQDTIIKKVIYYYRQRTGYYWDLNKYDNVVNIIEKQTELEVKLLGDSTVGIANNLTNVAMVYRFLGKSQKAIENLEKSKSIYIRYNFTDGVIKNHSELGTIYSKLGNYDQALKNWDYALKTADAKYGKYHPSVVLVHAEKGNYYLETFQYTKAIHSFKTAIRTYKNIPPETLGNQDLVNQVACKQAMSVAYLESGNSVDAAQYMRQAIEEMRSFGIYSQPHLANALLSYSEIHTSNKAYDKASKAIEEARQIMEEIYPNLRLHREWGDFYHAKGKFFYKQNQYDQALLACDSAFHSLIPNYDIDKDLPNQAEIKRNIAPNILHKVLELKIDIFGRTYVNQPKEETLKKALSGVGTLEIISQEMRIGKPEQHQFAWATILSTSYEKALSICYHAYKTTGDVQYMNQAFQIMEKNKSLLLLQAYQNTAAKKISQIPAEVLQQEKDLLYEQANLKQAIYESKNLQIKDSLNQLLVKQGVTYNNFVKQLEQNYPSYYELKYSLSITDLTTLQKSLAKDQIALSYFIGQEDSYVIQISKAKTYFKALPNVKKDSISAKIHKMRAAIYDFALNSAKHSNFRKDITVYTELSHQLYQDLVGNILEPENGKNRILLITSGILDYLPFGTLLTAPPTKIGQFKTYPYWIRDYAISYTQSATLWQQMQAAKAKHKTKANQLFLGFAPSFDPKAEASSNNHQIFAPLINNKEEVKDIFEMLSNRGQKILGNEASESNFKKLASAYRILHFATHGKFNRKDANYSKLAFSPVDSVEDGILYLHEIYNVELNADLVVLSACETGLGQLQQGEGIVSLARGFSFAGAKSLITTLWSVNDKSTSVFMITFYKYLKQGFPKDVALQKAQLYLIENSAAGQDISTSHPFFWSPYILIGDNKPMNLSDDSNTIWWYILGILGVLGIFGFWYFRR